MKGAEGAAATAATSSAQGDIIPLDTEQLETFQMPRCSYLEDYSETGIVGGGGLRGNCWDSNIVPFGYSHNTGVNGPGEFKIIVQLFP